MHIPKTPNRRKPRVLAHTPPSPLALGWLPGSDAPTPQTSVQGASQWSIITPMSLISLALERCIRDCVPACREQGKVVKSTALPQSPKDTEWLTKLRCYPAATTLLPLGFPTPAHSST
ncbi:hypothetical protein BDR03DRAFT_949393 [Suillus americanus]|nr:hypothetical protein BDR03DRAFT_949393 [Suillus americanus]